jgi:hypothetical protein
MAWDLHTPKVVRRVTETWKLLYVLDSFAHYAATELSSGCNGFLVLRSGICGILFCLKQLELVYT